ncbi:MAG: cupin domain-containing protein [Opitutaceae bacterium]|jgi:quercetin dioxygenase-like cupin family protein
MAETIFKPEECEVVSFAPLATIGGSGITRRTLLATSGGKVVLFSLDAGQEIAEHTNPNHALIQVLTGSLNLVLDGKRRVLGQGELLHMPPQLPHALRANGSTSFLLTLLSPVTNP